MAAAIWFSQSYFRNRSRPGQTPPAPPQTLVLDDKEQKKQTDLLILLEEFSDKNENARESGRKKIVKLGRQSDENRQIVIAELSNG